MAKSLLRTDDEIAEIYKRHVKTVYRVCYTYLKNPADTEDAVSDAFVRLIKSAPAFESEEHEKAWLIRTAANVCKDFLKHWSRRGEDIADYTDTLKAENAAPQDDLLAAVCGLPDKYKTVMHLYYYEGYTSVQIAGILRKPGSTIRNYLHEARGILRERLGDDFDEE
ncbi:MAG: RNA polymerase sigma factor [Oscillospiraceae bacterium]|jgi:RNA polymerase sigma-70 factor (ECF subfamily)|nr:RNA polymerase sigma factor [Oscillospiraceae bacterium]